LNTNNIFINRQTALISLGAFLAVLIAMISTASPLRAQDNDAIVGYRILGEEIAGPHRIQLQVSPVAPIRGTTRFAVRVRDAETGEDIDGATIRVFGTPAEKGKKQ